MFFEFGNAPVTELSVTPHDQLKVSKQVLYFLCRFLLHLITQALFDSHGIFTQYTAVDVGIDVHDCGC